MKKIAYIDCPSGIAGDMCLGALVDLGVPLDYLIDKLRGLGLEKEYRLWAEKVTKNGQVATKVHVDLSVDQHYSHEHHNARHLPEIQSLINRADLPPLAARWSLDIFGRLAQAEGAVHGIAPEKVHFHEVGAIDAIVDIVGTCLGLDYLGVDQFSCSPMPCGGGTVKAAHGRLSVPVPAVVKLWEMAKVPVYNNGIEFELVTPTGAAIATTLASSYNMPPMRVLKVGSGAGTKDLSLPNILRIWLGEIDGDQGDIVEVLETQIDDCNPQVIGYLFERLLAVGALDVLCQPVMMKKSRAGLLLTVICTPEKRLICESLIFAETTTLGIRKSRQERSILTREIQEVNTTYGKIKVKVAYQDSPLNPITVQPEYEDCAEIARNHNLPWRHVHELALSAWKDIVASD
ncbi:MAG: Pyridinium-3,5-bisthiocarboxylic acid mononucleotide nickel insertion protein [Chroococcopsis gigantea SAG 12.99]|jgi:uncharacterized protein (TIGR00299 family) protein|nr:Pyridinium-3,5-bisthiocarboxylic acid mononucleotide nickel insertion protein [Chroococcopsis gigantea SAG 12.99]